MRGGQPDLVIDAYATFGFSPHARGSPFRASGSTSQSIHPACAGVNPAPPVLSKGISDSPRMRGGQPARIALMTLEAQFSPHVRGSTHETDTVNSDGMIHPACAGVNPVPHLHWRAIQDSPPHARGVTLDITEAFDDRENSPHVRGSTWFW